jgi:hypothetical protein
MLDPGIEEGVDGGEWTRDKVNAFWTRLNDLAVRDPSVRFALLEIKGTSIWHSNEGTLVHYRHTRAIYRARCHERDVSRQA